MAKVPVQLVVAAFHDEEAADQVAEDEAAEEEDKAE